MKKLFTLAAAATLATAALGAQAQVAVDGVLNTAELTSGNYVLIGKFTNTRGFGDNGLLSLYVASTATKVYFFVGGTVENNLNGFQLFLKTPLSAGVPQGTALPAGTTGTYFEKMTSKMDMPVNLGFAFRADANGGTTFQFEGASYASATSATSKKLTSTASPIAGDGTAATIPTDAGFPAFALTRVAYKNTSTGHLAANPGNTASTTAAGYGGVGSYGLEVEMDRAAVGLVGAAPLTVFVLQNGSDGGYISSDFIPQTSVPPTTNYNNLATGAYDFTALPDRQAATVTLAATGGTALGTRAADAAALGLSVFPNPFERTSTVSYQVAEAAHVHIALTDLLGRTVRVLENGPKPLGPQTATVNAANLAAGTYLVRVQVGDRISTSKIAVQ